MIPARRTIQRLTLCALLLGLCAGGCDSAGAENGIVDGGRADGKTVSSDGPSARGDSARARGDSGGAGGDSRGAKRDGAAADALPSCSSSPKWHADHETGDLSQYTAGNTYGGSYDSNCKRPSSGVASSPVHRGRYAMKMTAPITASKPACRQFRYEESSLGHSKTAHQKKNALYYGAWLRFPSDYTVKDWSNIVQFKSKTYSKSKNDAFWVLELRNRKNSQGKAVMYLMLRYKGLYPGPHKGDPTGLKLYRHKKLDLAVPVAKWFHVQIYLEQSTNSTGKQSNYDGKLVVWQDGVEIYNMNHIATRYPDSWNEWSINVYAPTNGITVGGKPADFTLYVDDVAIDDRPVFCR